MISFEMNFFSNVQTYVKVKIRLAVLRKTFLNGLLQTFQLLQLSLEIIGGNQNFCFVFFGLSF
jgi:hypothetical protein